MHAAFQCQIQANSISTGNTCINKYSAPAVRLLRGSVHGALDNVLTAVALPPVAAIEVDLVMHGVVHSDVIPTTRPL